MSTALGIIRVDHIALRVPDYDATIAFYTEILGFEVIKEWTLPGVLLSTRFAYVALGSFEVEIIGGGQLTAIVPALDIADHLSRGDYGHLCLRVGDLDAVVAALKAKGVAVLAEPFEVEPIGQRLAMIHDNSGNIIELTQATV